MNLSGHRLALGSALACALAAILCAHSGLAGADPVPPGGRAAESAPPELTGVEVVEKLGAALPLDLTFTDETGAPIRLGALFGDGRPVILTFNYSSCPLLCSVQLGGLVEAMNKLEWSAGKEFRVITIGLDPNEGHRRAMDSKLAYLARYRRQTADEGWRFLTGTDASIGAAARAVGFGYRKHPTRSEYLHPAVLMLVSPKGDVSSYLYGVSYDAGQLGKLLAGAGRGTVTESIRKFLLACFHYDSPGGAAAAAMQVMRAGGLLFVVGMLAVFGARAGRARARRKRERTSASMASTGSRS